MGAFGFDPSIILAGKAPEMSPEDALRMGQSISAQRQQQQMQQATLADILYKQQRARSLADITRQNAGSFEDPMARAYALGGFGDEAGARQREQLQQKADYDKFLQLHGDLLRSQASTIKTPEQYKKWVSGVSPEGRAMYGLPEEHDANALQSFIASGMTPQERGKYEDEQRRRSALADATSPTSTIRTTLGKQFGLPVSAGMPGNAIDDKELDLGERAQAAKERAATARLMMGGGGVNPEALGLTPGALDSAATRYHFGENVQVGRDPGGYVHKAIMKRADEMFPKDNIAGNRTQLEAQKQELKEAVTSAGAQDVKEGKALGDIQILKGTMGKIFGSNIQALNWAGRMFQELSRDPNYAAYQTSLAATLPSINAVLNSGQMSVGAREEVKHLLLEKDNPAAMNKAIDILIQDMSRSTEASHKRITNARARLDEAAAPGGAPKVTPLEAVAPEGKTSAPGGKQPPGGHMTVTQRGHAYTWNPDTGQYE